MLHSRKVGHSHPLPSQRIRVGAQQCFEFSVYHSSALWPITLFCLQGSTETFFVKSSSLIKFGKVSVAGAKLKMLQNRHTDLHSIFVIPRRFSIALSKVSYCTRTSCVYRKQGIQFIFALWKSDYSWRKCGKITSYFCTFYGKKTYILYLAL